MGRRAIPIEPYIDKLVQAVSIGATYEMAALYAGISYKTFERWRLRADKAPEGSPLATLRLRLLEAEGRAAIGWLARIEAAAQGGDWQAAKYKLEHRWPQAYGPHLHKVALTTPDGQEPWEPTVIYLPSKAPTAEQWAEDVKQLLPSSNGHIPEDVIDERAE